jgi:hypothetical protein
MIIVLACVCALISIFSANTEMYFWLKITHYRGRMSVCLQVPLSKIYRWIMIKFGIGSLQETLWSAFYVGAYLSDIKPI